MGPRSAPATRNLTKEPLATVVEQLSAGRVAADMVYFQPAMGLVSAPSPGGGSAGSQHQQTLSPGSCHPLRLEQRMEADLGWEHAARRTIARSDRSRGGKRPSRECDGLRSRCPSTQSPDATREPRQAVVANECPAEANAAQLGSGNWKIQRRSSRRDENSRRRDATPSIWIPNCTTPSADWIKATEPTRS